ncbi:MAG: chemotaxis protein CheW [Pseudomonadota bacterium]
MPDPHATDTTQYLTSFIGGQVFAVSLHSIRDVIEMIPLTPVPLAPDDVAGIVNLRGRLVTTIRLDRLLGIPVSDDQTPRLAIVFEQDGALYSLLVHGVGDVLTLNHALLHPLPATLDQRWAQLSTGLFRLDKSVLLVLDINRIYDTLTKVCHDHFSDC